MKVCTFWMKDVFKLEGKVMSRKSKVHVEGEFPGMPERSKLGKVAADYLEKLDALEGAKSEKEGAALMLVEAFKESGETSISVEGRTVSVRHRAAEDIVKVTKPKER